ncbi:hypothetical protein MKW94_019484 [Papaver nudicaule]|uniref:Uncharacterized protein n=1 Tax=Papaver nudicaule TaxID=74823 RepID=A0AA41S806_PAPNU|nr:hypothetical protein [Papaver nudicaule]
MNSLVSLKGLAEICCVRQRYDDNPAPKEIFLKQHKKDEGEIDVDPSLTMTQYSGNQVVSPLQNIDSDLDKSIHMPVGAQMSHSSKVSDRNVGNLRKRKSHCSDIPEMRDDSPQEVYCSDENTPNHLTRRSIQEKIVVDMEIFLDDEEDMGETSGEVGATSPLKQVTKRHRDDSDVSDQGSETEGLEPDRQPMENGRTSLLISPLDRSERGKIDCPLPEYTSPQLCPPGFIMVAGFPVLPEYKGLYTRVIASKGHLASDAKVKLMYIQATMVAELLKTIQRMSELSCRDVTSTDLQQWRAAVDTASAMDFHVSWLDDQLHLLESQIRDVEEQKATMQSLEAEVRGCRKRIPLLNSKKNEARRTYEAAKADKAELIAKLSTLKASLASFKANNQATMALTCPALGSCLGTPH